MTRVIENLGLVLMLAGVVVSAVAVWRSVQRAGVSGCPGVDPGGAWWRWAWSPWRWVRRPWCGYDLSGAPVVDGVVTCPECGRRGAVPARRRAGGRWRAGVVSAVLLAAGVACWEVRWVRGARWAGRAPTGVLLAAETAAPWFWSPRLEQELSARSKAGVWWVWGRWLERCASVAMGADGARYNADWGASVLGSRLPGSMPAVERALESGDRQRRQYAAGVVMGAVGRGVLDAGALPESFWEAAVEGLADDSHAVSGDMAFGNARAFTEFLVRHSPRAAGPLLRALSSADGQQRVLSASVLARAGREVRPDLAWRAGPVLCEHLRDNGIEGDAVEAARALLAMGPLALAPLERFAAGEGAGGAPDRQGALTAEYLVRHLRGEPLTRAERRRLNVITSVRGNTFED
ncbi:MAG: hypothetical protein HRU70_00765 [Phycisphaeraceae bacterium]|nr:MAG: hypothetical protein HRU70_00765 [Phycisphaeraceae bacterium]